jgi:hypothetical protein
MKLELPPERQLPNSEWMVERILTESPSSARRRPAARTYWLSGLVAAALVITVAVIGWAVLLPSERSQVGAPPESSVSVSEEPSDVGSPTVSPSRPSAATSTSGPTSTASGPRERPTQRPPATPVPTRPATSANTLQSSTAARAPSASETPKTQRSAEPPLTTTVPIGVRVQAPYLNLTASGTMNGGDVYAILVETCVRTLPPDASSDLPLSRNSWTLSTSAGTVTTDAPINDPIELPSTYPSQGRYGIGDCASGWIAFGVPSDTAVFAISYRNSLGANVTWNPNT